ncbi:MAG TPA: hypothetical protein VF331_05900 [Polyangiales bacterium]
MARKKNTPESTDAVPTSSDELVDQLLGDYKSPEQLTGPNGLIKQLVAKLVTRAMSVEFDQLPTHAP